MLAASVQSALTAAGGDVRFDNLTRQLYATDASIYQVEPLGVAFPGTAAQAAALVRTARAAGVPVIPRGAGSGLVGGALGRGLVIDFSRHNRQITGFDPEQRRVRVGAGVVLDALNAFLRPHGFCFGPDVATSSRATLGGMIANDSSGARTPCYGTTADHVRSIDLITADGRIERVGPAEPGMTEVRALARRLAGEHGAEIAERLPAGRRKRWPGYGISRLPGDAENLNHLLAGSEGTLGAIVSAELSIVPLPREKGLAVVFFASVADAMRATVELLPLQPVAIEHVDRVLFDQTRGQAPFRAARDLLELDAQPGEAFLVVEFYDQVADRLAAVAARRLGLRTRLLQDPSEMNRVWALRKAGLSLLTGCPGPAKPVTGIEDAAVPPERLPEYVAGLRSILAPLGVQACFYGHAASGLLHVRPVLDLHETGDVRKFRTICDEVAALVRQFKGSLAAEHGVGIARTQYLRDQLGDRLLGVMREVKTAFDPENLFNPGKIVDPVGWNGPRPDYGIDRPLRGRGDRRLELPFAPVLAFAAKDHSFIGNLEQCNGCGGCRKETPTMCPTFVATGEEIMSTRGRANAIRAALDGRGSIPGEALRSVELEAALAYCLSCKACTTECPSNVNLALLKAELLHARHRRDGLPLSARLISAVDTLGRLGCLAPDLANAALRWPPLRRFMERTIGFSARRALPEYTAERFDSWFHRRPEARSAPRGRVLLWDDTFVRYHEPQIGQAAVAVLEAAGFEVVLPQGRQCCGRPAFSQGHLDAAREMGRHNLELLTARYDAATPVLFLEPSCWAMFREDYRELRLAGAESVASRCVLFESFIEALLRQDPEAVPWSPRPETVAIHAHCHAKALASPAEMRQLAQRLPGREVTLLETGCCGMAGAFGTMVDKYDLSVRVAQPLLDQLHRQPPGTVIVASGTSCRQQIRDLGTARPVHMAELLAAALAEH